MFEFTSLLYRSTMRGVLVEGYIIFNDDVVGYFCQKPFEACVPYFLYQIHVDAFEEYARKNNQSYYTLSEELLRQAEKKILYQSKEEA